MKADLPNGWELINVHEAAKELFAGGDVPKNRMSKERTEEFQIPIFGNGLNESGLYGYTDVPKVDQECITISARGTIGFPIHRTTPFYPIVRLIVLIPKPTLNTKYIFYYLKSVDFINTGTSIPQLTVPQVKQLNVPIAPLPEQQRIVTKLDAVFGHLDQVREKLDRIPVLLKNFRQQVLTQAVTGELTREWREGKILEEIDLKQIEDERRKLKLDHSDKRGKKSIRYKESVNLDLGGKTKGLDELFELPKTWNWVSIDMVVWNVSDGPHFSPEYVDAKSGKKFISARNIQYIGVDFSDCKYVSLEDHLKFIERGTPEKEILF